HLVGNVTGGAQNDDRNGRRLLLDFAANIPAGHRWQPQIEHNGGRPRGPKRVQSGFSVRTDFHGESLRLEQTLQRFLHGALVVHPLSDTTESSIPGDPKWLTRSVLMAAFRPDRLAL